MLSSLLVWLMLMVKIVEITSKNQHAKPIPCRDIKTFFAFLTEVCAGSFTMKYFSPMIPRAEKGTAKKRKRPKPSHRLRLEYAQTQVISQMTLAAAIKP